MPAPRVVPFGSWKSPITADLVASESLGLGQIALDGGDIYWVEMRPAEEGRCVIVRRTPDGLTTDVTPPPFSARTRVHEYGGGAFAVRNGVVYFSNFTDQRLYVQGPDASPMPITPAGPLRYADGVIDSHRGRLICVREDHTASEREAVNTLVGVDLRGSGVTAVLASGHDFYSSPRLSPDGTQLAWLAWDHPNMPWDGTELWLGEVAPDGSLRGTRRLAGGDGESIFQPEWAPNGILHFVSDRTGWWNLYRWRGKPVPLWKSESEFGAPQWVFGMSTYAFESLTRILCAFKTGGTWRLATLDTAEDTLTPIELPYSLISNVRAGPGQAVFGAASARESPAIVLLHLAARRVEVLRRQSTVAIDRAYLSSPQAIEFPTEGGRTAHAFFYPPRNREHTGRLSSGVPPLLVQAHGGPTGAASNTLNLEIQYWTSRGIAVADVNYGGSTGYGRAYRERLLGEWGVVDVDDCVNCARYLSDRGFVDPEMLAIRGGSAGGYTTLCALAFRTVFKAGASHFGISDLETFHAETHKFESHYDHRLIGPYPQRRDLYRGRSPIHAVDRLSSPLILFQGLEDKIVPPNQAERMFEALRANGVPVAYVAFAGEQHGFRRAGNIKRALEAELYFYARVFGFELADAVEPVPIENL